MSIRHHPDEALLLDYASGAADEGVGLIVATHLCFCRTCRDTVALAEAAGGALLGEIAPAHLQPEALDTALARLDSAAGSDGPMPLASGDGTPSPLRALLGGDISALRWRRMGPSLAFVNLFRRGAMRARLLRGVPGSDTGLHGHHGLEYTLVLQGGFTDESGSYGPGDVQVATPDMRHNPVADPGADCINLAVTMGALRFDAFVPRLAAKLFGF